jgi:enamine deaminase RidA (YjgF/YER057c/UK114 family)
MKPLTAHTVFSHAPLTCADRCPVPGGARARLRLEYVSRGRMAGLKGVLGVATYGAPSPALARRRVPLAAVHAPPLAGPPGLCELWQAAGSPAAAVRTGRHGRRLYRATDELLFGCITWHEEELAAEAAARGTTALHEATERAYREMLALVDHAGYPYLVRVWNYLGDINRHTHGLERYRQFNSARLIAMQAAGRAVAGAVPAACALGTLPGSPLVVYFLASRAAPLFLENPRQVSAYHYPSEYGARSPVFSRGAVLPAPAVATLFLSGTASIVGHSSVHVGDVAAQTRETFLNIQAVVEEARRVSSAPFTLADLRYKVYVRQRSDLPVIQREVAARLGPAARAIYLQADICRHDLLLEIEATGQAPAGP